MKHTTYLSEKVVRSIFRQKFDKYKTQLENGGIEFRFAELMRHRLLISRAMGPACVVEEVKLGDL